MISANGKILVSVDFSQKKSADVGGTTLLLAKEFTANRREQNPVLCKVETGNENVPCGTYLLVHHNRFVEDSPHHLGGNLYSLAYNQSIFASVDEDGNANQMCGNIIVEHTFDEGNENLPAHLITPNKHKYKVLQQGYGYKKGQHIFCFPFSDYEIIYVWKGTEHRVVKVWKDDIVGKIIFDI